MKKQEGFNTKEKLFLLGVLVVLTLLVYFCSSI